MNCFNHDFYCGGLGFNSVYEVPTDNYSNLAVFEDRVVAGEWWQRPYTGSTAEEQDEACAKLCEE